MAALLPPIRSSQRLPANSKQPFDDELNTMVILLVDAETDGRARTQRLGDISPPRQAVQVAMKIISDRAVRLTGDDAKDCK